MENIVLGCSLTNWTSIPRSQPQEPMFFFGLFFPSEFPNSVFFFFFFFKASQNYGNWKRKTGTVNLARPPPRLALVLPQSVLTTCWPLSKPLKGDDALATSLRSIFHSEIWLTARALAFEILFLLLTHFRLAMPFCAKSNEAAPGGCSARIDI